MCVSDMFSGQIKCFIKCEGGETVARAIAARRQAAGHSLAGLNKDMLSYHDEPDRLVMSSTVSTSLCPSAVLNWIFTLIFISLVVFAHIRDNDFNKPLTLSNYSVCVSDMNDSCRMIKQVGKKIPRIYIERSI